MPSTIKRGTKTAPQTRAMEKSAPTPKAMTRVGQPPKTLQEKAHDLIRHDIISGVLRPGERIIEGRLCERYGIGRTPVHQALSQLELHGLIEVRPRKGTAVRRVTFDELLQLGEARLVNEMEMARLAASRITDEEASELPRISSAMAAAVAKRDVWRLMTLDREFHAVIHHAARNPIIAEFLEMLYDRSMRVWYVSLKEAEYIDGVQDDHDALVDAVCSHNPEAAAAAMRAHVLAYRNNLQRLV